MDWKDYNRFIVDMKPGEHHRFDDHRAVVKFPDGTYVVSNGSYTRIGVRGIEATNVLNYDTPVAA